MNQIYTTVKNIIVEKFNVDEKEVTLDAYFTNDLGMNSLEHVELIMECEAAYNISVPDEEAEKCNQVKQLVDYIESVTKK